MLKVGDVLWQPSQEWIEQTNIHAYRLWLKETRDLEFDSLLALRRWSVANLEDFWQSIWDYFKVEASTPPTGVFGRREMPGTEWFPGAKLNYAQHILRREKPGTEAMYFANESNPLKAVMWDEFAGNVRILATQLRKMGI